MLLQAKALGIDLSGRQADAGELEPVCERPAAPPQQLPARSSGMPSSSNAGPAAAPQVSPVAAGGGYHPFEQQAPQYKQCGVGVGPAGGAGQQKNPTPPAGRHPFELDASLQAAYYASGQGGQPQYPAALPQHQQYQQYQQQQQYRQPYQQQHPAAAAGQLVSQLRGADMDANLGVKGAVKPEELPPAGWKAR